MERTFERLVRLFNKNKAPGESIITRQCWGCGKKLVTKDINQRYCSKECKIQRKEKLSWTQAPDPRKIKYTDYIRSEAWQKKAEAAKKRAGYRCQVCNRDRSEILQLEAHHRTYEYLGEERSQDITVLCNECHELFSKNGRLAKVPR